MLFPGQPVGLSSEEITVASVLKGQGYATKIVGKWHCGDQPEFLPTRHGFDGYYGLPYSNDMGHQKGREHYPPLPLLLDEDVIQEQPDQSSITERYVEKAVQFVRKNSDRPFFLYLAHMYVHLPLYAPDRFLRHSRNGAYGAAVECIDWAAGVLMHELTSLGLDRNTLVIFTSDNGSRGDHGGSNAPLRGHKGTTWEGGQRVPCIMRWPDRIRPGVTSGELVTSMDFMPTLAAVAGTQAPRDRAIDGKNLLPLMEDPETAKSPREAFFYYLKDNLEAVRAGDWKLHVRKGEDEIQELYDLGQDIAEAHNVYESHPDVVSRLEDHIETCRQDLGDLAVGREGAGCRPCGQVENADTLTHFDPQHPYFIALYDLDDAG